MKCHICAVLLIVTLESVCAGEKDRFFISAPTWFHVGVKEKVFVQLGGSHLNNPVTFYLEDEKGTVMSEKIQTMCANEGDTKIIELMINKDIWSQRTPSRNKPYLQLWAESPSFTKRRSTKVYVSTRRGYIFIQTDQPIYNPKKTVKYRIFTLDHTLRPYKAIVQISIFNPAGNRVKNLLKIAQGGILTEKMDIPDVAEMGTWKITAHYEKDPDHAASREFTVQKFVLPSFEVSINMEQKYILLNAAQIDFPILAMYSYGERVHGTYHCRFGIKRKTFGQETKPVFIRGTESTGSVTEGNARVQLQVAQLNNLIQKQLNTTLSDLLQSEAELYMGVAVTNIQSGEVQQSEVSLPIISNKYTIDLSRSRSFFIPGASLDVEVVVRLPDGSPAVDVPVEISALSTGTSMFRTNQQGAVAAVFNVPTTTNTVTVQVSVEDQQKSKVLQRASSPSNSYLYLNMNHKTYAVGASPIITYEVINGPPNGFIYYMVLSRGMIIKKGTFTSDTKQLKLDITADMVPSFRLIGYYYDASGNIIADSLWIDVEDQCEIQVKLTGDHSEPGKKVNLKIDLNGQTAKVALLAVDKAIYALKAQNKLTAKQVFSSMESHDLGCSYGGGSDPASTINDAGLAFVSHLESGWRGGSCKTLNYRHTRSLDIEQEMMDLKSNFSSKQLQDCCTRGFSLLPMRRTCEQRAKRVSQWHEDPLCAETFLRCCLKGETLRQKKAQEDARKGLGRTATTEDIEEYFMLIDESYVRRMFPPSFEFKVYDINNEKNSVPLILPDSITTWEIQAVTLSPTTGFCVAQPSTIVAFQEIFVSLRLPYSVRKHEQISITPVIYNYGQAKTQLAVHMEQTEGLCSPGSATSSSFVNITLEPMSSQFVVFTAVPMVTGSIPIKIRLYDIENYRRKDAVEKILNVQTEGMEYRTEKSYALKLDGTTSRDIDLDGTLPDGRVPDSSSNIFISLEGEGFNRQNLVKLLSPEGVHSLIRLPRGCLEQTMSKLAPTVFAIRYLDESEQWFELPAGARDQALQHIEDGYVRILGFKRLRDKSYGSWTSGSPSVWMTAYVVKVMSLVAERQSVSIGQQGRRVSAIVEQQQITEPINFLLSKQSKEGMFVDPYPVYHRIMGSKENIAFTTAYTALALRLSLPFNQMGAETQAAITKAATYVRTEFEELQNPYVVAISAYCLSVCRAQGTDVSYIWTKLSSVLNIGEDQCSVGANNGERKIEAAIQIETVAYALLTAMELGLSEWADNAVCWLISQKNYQGGFVSSQDTIMALEALTAYELGRTTSTFSNVTAEFSVQGKTDVLKLTLRNRREALEIEAKKFTGTRIVAHLTGQGNATLKIMKAYHLMAPKGQCEDLSITVTVEGAVSYTTKILEDYEYYDEGEQSEGNVARVTRSAVEWSDAHIRDRRATDQTDPEKPLNYTICVRADRNLTGMGIADITLLSGMEPLTEDLDKLKSKEEQYISHYELTKGRLILYFDQLFDTEECISFRAKQVIPIGLLQPAPAVFYDYYEPNIKCTVFYSAPRRSKMVSKLCSGDVCQCAEKPCHKEKSIFASEDQRIKLNARQRHACFFPIVDYAYIVEVLDVSVKSNFEMYTTNVTDVLKNDGDQLLEAMSARVFAKRLQCKGSLVPNERYLIMGMDGATTDTNGAMQYMLESNTWVEKLPSKEECQGSNYRTACRLFRDFVSAMRVDGCKQ
ncbi:complement C4-B [Genypterus blacodes]|uniref:complement C4-B n=1 Tax=Genypterus blacodes TaxID=154954 RepID=UPI003F770F8D